MRFENIIDLTAVVEKIANFSWLERPLSIILFYSNKVLLLLFLTLWVSKIKMNPVSYISSAGNSHIQINFQFII